GRTAPKPDSCRRAAAPNASPRRMTSYSPSPSRRARQRGAVLAAGRTTGPCVLALLGLALGMWVSLAVFERIPHNEDELAFLFQAKVFAGGALRAPSPPQPD